MACSGCRKAPNPVRQPSSINNTRSVPKQPTVNSNSTGGQRSRITGLTYVPNKK